MGGVGKTQIANKFIEDHLKRYNLVWTFDAESNFKLQESYRELAQELKLISENEKAVPPEEILTRVNRWLKAPNNHGWLLYFDNAESVEIVQQKIFQQKDNLPQFGGKILITSRTTENYNNFYYESVISVTEFNRDESIQLLKKIIPEKKQKGEDQLNALAKELGDFPLALDQAGSFIRNNVIGLTITDYLGYFKGDRREIWEAEQKEAAGKPYSATVAMTWKITMDYIKGKFPNAAKALNLCAYLNATEIPLKWLLDWWKEKTPTKGFQLHKELNDLVKPLVDFSLLRQQETQKMLSVHRLIQLVTQDNLSEEEREEFIREGLRLIEGRFDAYDDDDPKTWGKGRKCMPHAISVTNHVKKGKYLLKNTDLKEILSPILNVTDEMALSLSQMIFYASDQGRAASLFYQMAMYAYRQGNAFKAKKYYTQALEMTKAFLGESHSSVASTLNNLGLAWISLGENKKAIEYFEQALEMTKAVLGESHPSVASVLNNLGVTWNSLGEKKKAIEYFEQALEMKKAVLGESHPSVAETLNNLGTAWSDLGEKKKAIEYHEKALEMTKAVFGESHPSVAGTLHNLGNAWSELGENKKAIEYHEKALEMKKAFLGESHPSVAKTLNNLGNAWSSLGEKKKAIEYYEQALEMKKAFFGESHPSVADTLHNLGTAWSELGEKKKATQYYEKALEMTKAFFGESHPSVADTLNNLGNAWSSLGEKKKATQYYEKALEIFKAFLGESHPSVADTLNNLGNAWSDLGENKKAIEYYEKAIEMKKAFLGESHPSVASILNNLAYRYSALGQDQKAIEFLKQAKHIYKTHHDKNPFDYINMLDSLAEIYNNAKEYSKSLLIAEKALKICEEVHKDGHWIVSSLLIQMGRAHYKQKQFQQAQEYQSKALTLAEKLTSNTNLSIQKGNALLALGKTQRAQHNPQASLDFLQKARDLFIQTYSPKHSDVAKCHHALGKTYQALQQQKKALDSYTQAYETALSSLPEDHPDLLKYKESLKPNLTSST